jgi:hypothetical protein
MSPPVHAAGSYRGRLPRPKGAIHHDTHHGDVMGRIGKVSKISLPVALACALAALAERPATPRVAPPIAAEHLVESCRPPEREIRFEMLAPDAEPQAPAGRGLPVCLAVYRPQPAP